VKGARAARTARGTPLAPDDPKMRALEAYIYYAQRKGTPLDYGRR